MSITQYKALIWTLALGVGGYLGWYVFDFYQRKDELKQAVSKETQTAVLESVPPVEPPKEDVVEYELVRKTWHEFDWTGKPPAKVVERPADAGPVQTPKKPVADLLKVLLVQVDADDQKGSMAHVTFSDSALMAANPKPDDSILRVGERLDAPYDAIEVAAIVREGVRFRFLAGDGQPDPERGEELVEPSRIIGSESIVSVGPDGVLAPTRPGYPTATQRPRGVPADTTLIGMDHWLVGLNDREMIQRDYTKLLAELRFAKHFHPKTGKPDGVEIKDVPPGSFGAKYGAKPGQVIKSINGHPISSVNEGISFAKQNADKYDVWEIVYEEQGKEKTKIIDTSD
jgi:hypothetical protein